MRLYEDDKLVSEAADAPLIEAALKRLATVKEGSVDLEKSPEECLSAVRDVPGYLGLELAEGGCVSGIVLGIKAIEEARTAFLEYLFDLKPAIFAGDPEFDDDCPLCQSVQRDLREQRAAH